MDFIISQGFKQLVFYLFLGVVQIEGCDIIRSLIVL
jgi:hypothetical protein